MELKRDEIIKAMECCYDNTLSCIDCPFQAPDKYMECSGLTLSALALIKELTEEKKKSDRVFSDLYKEAETYLAQRDCLRNLVKNLTEENERLRAENKALINENEELKNQIQEPFFDEEDVDLYDEFTKLLTEGIREAKANNVSEIKTRFAMRYGTYTDKDMTPITEVFRLLDRIAKEMLEGENES